MGWGFFGRLARGSLVLDLRRGAERGEGVSARYFWRPQLLAGVDDNE